jgi:hypothetical protein
MILLVSRADDACTDMVQARLRQSGSSFFRFDIADLPGELGFTATVDTYVTRGLLSSRTAQCPLEDVTAVYYRRPRPFVIDEPDAERRATLLGEARHGFGGVLLALRAHWINHPARAADAEYKPWQLASARDAGLQVPQTIITNNATEAASFADGLGGIVVDKKIFVPLTRTDLGLTFEPAKTVSALDLRRDAARIGRTAHLFQEYVRKESDVRVTVVGSHAHAVRIRHDVDGILDWRTRLAAATLTETTVPDSVLRGIATYLRSFGLYYGAFDFAVTADDSWYFLECNPNGSWEWLPDPFRDQIVDNLADFLATTTQPERAGDRLRA